MIQKKKIIQNGEWRVLYKKTIASSRVASPLQVE